MRTTGSGKRRLGSVREPRRLAAVGGVTVAEQTRASAKGRERISAAVLRRYQALREKKRVQEKS